MLAGLPAALRGPVLQAVRNAADRLGRPQLPAALRPYAGFTAQALGEGKGYQAVVRSLVADARLREAVGRTADEALWRQAEGAPLADLAAAGPERAAVALLARGRWEDLGALSANVRAAQPEREPEPAQPRTVIDDTASRNELTIARRERDEARRRATAAEQRLARVTAERDGLRTEVAALKRDLAAADQRAVAESARIRDRLARLQRRASDAQARARTEDSRLAVLAGELERVAAALRDGPEDPPPASAAAATQAPAISIPRGVAPATRGRPCTLPPGITPAHSAAFHALLAVEGIEVILDGYNVTKDLRGVPAADLRDQRAWLERLVGGAGAAHGRRMTIVFDGEGTRTSAVAGNRLVRSVFTAEGEIADERIVTIVASLPEDTPVVVVSSDREVRHACEELGANVVASGVFLQAVG